MDGRVLDPTAKPFTYLQRAFLAFKTVAPAPLSARALAAVLGSEIESTYNYIARLKRMKKIRISPIGTARFPRYVLVEGATLPPNDSRGRKPSRPPTPAARWKKVGT